jgi:hypothetical protein
VLRRQIRDSFRHYWQLRDTWHAHSDGELNVVSHSIAALQ